MALYKTITLDLPRLIPKGSFPYLLKFSALLYR